jgi:phenylalanyl-tRNA synthetase alpha chain
MDPLNIGDLEQELEQAMKRVSSEQELEQMRTQWIGTKGLLKSLFQQLASLEQSKKVETARSLNHIKATVEAFVERKREEFAQQRQQRELESQWVDFTLPSKNVGRGVVHPIRQVERMITKLLKPFGFRCVEGPEVESEYYCFDALNIPKHHPARDMQDTFYTDPEGVLRTHTTSVQARELEKGALPVKIITCGRTYRNEAEDSSHQSMFHQFDLVWVEEGITLSHLHALLIHILHGLYGKERKVRFVPKYYPYTEPSIGAQIDCLICHGKGCPSCKGSGWVTILGAGMIHENVLKEFHYDPRKVSGMAFGAGTSRLAAQFFHLPNLRSLYVNDLRLLRSLA